MGHTMSGKEKNKRVFVDMCQNPSNRAINGSINLSNRIPREGDNFSIIIRVSRVVKMPALMARAMALGKYLGKKVPFTFIHVMYGKLAFLINTLDQ